jgi:hypothetical protein
MKVSYYVAAAAASMSHLSAIIRTEEGLKGKQSSRQAVRR